MRLIYIASVLSVISAFAVTECRKKNILYELECDGIKKIIVVKELPEEFKKCKILQGEINK